MPIFKQVTYNLLTEEQKEIHEKALEAVGKRGWSDWVRSKERELVLGDIDITNEQVAEDLHIEVANEAE